MKKHLSTQQKKTAQFRFFQQGLTILEMLVVLGIMAVLFSLTTINLTNLVPKANVTTTVDVLVADLKAQQQKSMSGETGVASASGQAQPFGIHFDSNQYVLYSGVTYSANSASNSAIPVANTLRFTSTFPSGNVLFARGSGEVSGFTSTASATVTISNTTTNEASVIQLNKFGVVTQVSK